MHHHHAAGLLHALRHGVIVEGNQRPGIDDLGGDALLGQFFGSLQRPADIQQVGDDGDIGAFPLDIGLAEGDA